MIILIALGVLCETIASILGAGSSVMFTNLVTNSKKPLR